jgi:hypothetical protein
MDELETINLRMRAFLLCQAAGFFAWQAADGIGTSHQTPDSWMGPGLVISGIGFGLWLVTIILYFGDAFRAYKTVGYDIINDDWARDVRRRAAEAAFWVITVSTVLAMTFNQFGVDGGMLLKILTGLSVSSFFLAAVHYDRKGESGGEA